MSMPNTSANNILETRLITKTYPGVVALDQVSVTVQRGAVHALMGENGAGKSTLGKVIAGLIEPDQGELILEGAAVHFTGPLAAMRAGIGMVHQELVFCENLTVAENLCLDDLPAKGPWLDRKEMRRRAESWLAAIGGGISADTVVGELPISKQQMVQIAGAVGRGAKILIFDEPTSSLSQRETALLFERIRTLKAEGVTCIYVSHRMDEVYELCDTVTVLRDGKLVDTVPLQELSRDELVRKMIGRNIELVQRQVLEPSQEEPVLSVKNLASPAKFEGVNLEVKPGEIVGIAGLVGAGRSEILEAIFGLDSLATGEISVRGKPAGAANVAHRMSLGIGLVPEDRKRQGLVLSMTSRENISLPTLKELSKAGWVRRALENKMAGGYFAQMRVKAPSIESVAIGLSGGNQQKLVIAKWLAAHCDILMLDEPTRGVDVGAKAEIYGIIRELAHAGRGVLVVSSELPELIALATRILVVRDGRLVGEIHGEQITEEALMRQMTGVGEEKSIL